MDKKNLRIIYLGTPEISAQVLDKLIENGYNIVAVVSQVDKPVGRKQVITPTPVKKVALAHNIPCFQPEKIRNDFEFIKEYKPDILLTMAYGQIIPHDMLLIPTFKPLNLHGSLLPKYRGASPIQTCLFNGDSKTGITLMEMVDEMDAGNMFYKKIIDITLDDNYDTLQEKMVNAAFEAFDKGIEPIINDNYEGEIQNKEEVTFTRKIKPEDQIIDFNEDAISIVNRIRALTTHPGAYFVYKNEKIKVLKAHSIDNDLTFNPGTIKKYDKTGFIIETSKGLLSIDVLQKPGKKPIGYKDFINGNKEYFKENTNINE